MSLQIIDSEIIKKTQNTLGNIIKKPPLTEKLLSKPPFRFLHDIFTSVIKSTGFMNGLFTEAEMVSENVKDKEPKIEFLQKCIDFIALVTGQKVAAKPQKMVAGAEPEKTNEMLQLLAMAVEKNVDNDEYIKRYFRKTSDKHEKSDKHKEKNEEKKKKKDRSSHEKDGERKDSKKRGEDDDEKEERRRKRREERSRREEGKENEEKKEKKHHRSRDEKEHKKHHDDDGKKRDDNDDDNDKKRKNDENEDSEKAERRRRRREEKEAHKKSDKEERHKRKEDKNDDKENKSEKREKKESRSKREHRDKSETRDKSPSKERKSSKHRSRSRKDDDDSAVASTSNHSKTNEEDDRPHNKSFSRMARPNSARAAPPRLRAKEEETITPVPQLPTLDKKLEEEDEDDDDDYIIKEDYPPIEEEVEVDANKEEDNADHGNLVKNILETKKEFESNYKNVSKNNVYEGIQQKDKELMVKEIEGMREMLQLSSKNINPLGKTMDFLQEDMDSILKELNAWNEETKNNKALQQNEESKTEAALEPLKTQVRELDQAILIQIEQINAVKCNIINNEKKINQLFSSLFKP